MYTVILINYFFMYMIYLNNFRIEFDDKLFNKKIDILREKHKNLKVYIVFIIKTNCKDIIFNISIKKL